MNWNKIILSTIRGEQTNCLPFIPRLDLWYKANKKNKTLPKKYSNASLKEITKDLRVGYHAVVPDFRNFIDKKSQGLLALGIYDLKSNPYKIVLDSIDFSVVTKNDITVTVFNTPFGKITSKYLYSQQMEKSGTTIGFTLEHPIKTVNDFNAVSYIFKNIEVEKNFSGYDSFKTFVGEDGVAVGFTMLAASPMHHIMKELTKFENFVYLLNDNEKEVLKLAEDIDIFYDKVLALTMKSNAEIIFLGANYDSFQTWPPFFKNHITPFLKKWSNITHLNGKFMLTHTDGENEGLLDEYLLSGFDIADSICPFPMTSLTLNEIREIFGERICIWGGIPSICLLEESMNNYNFEKYLDNLINNLGTAKRLILSFADTTPPNAKFERILKVIKVVNNFKK